jgi:hypothetical protein
MLVWDILQFMKEQGEPDVSIGDPQVSYFFFFDIINSGQFVLIEDDKGIACVALYLKVRNLDEIRKKRGTFHRLRNYRCGRIVYVHTVVVRRDLRNNGLIWKIAKQIRDKELLSDTVAFTFNKNEKWTYKIERRRNHMRDNCGIIALDALLKSMSLNMNRISLDTLAKICRDNGRLMFPLKVKKSHLPTIPFPYIMQTNNHYEVIEDETALEGADIPEDVYLLYPQLNATTIPHVIDEEEAKQVKGAGGGKVSDIPLIGQFISKPGRLLPLAVSAAAPMLGIGSTMGNILGTAAGAGQGLSTGLWGEPGAGSALKGGATGFLTAPIGRGLGTGLANAFASYPGATDVNRLGVFGTGFGQGFAESIPFKNAINKMVGQQFFTPDLPGVNALPGYNYSPTSAANLLTGNISTVGPGGSIVSGQGEAMKGYAMPTPDMNTPSWWGGGGAGTATAPAQAGAAGGQAAGGTGIGGGKWLPTAASLLGALALPEPEYDVPSAESIYKEMIAKQDLPTTYGALGQAAQAATLKNINAPDTILTNLSQPYKDAIISDLNRREQDELAFVRTVHAQNGTSGGSDEMRDIQNVQAKYRDARNQQLGEIETNLYNQKVEIYLKSIADAYGMDQQNLATIAGLTNASISEAAIKYGIKAQQVKDFRDALYALATATNPASTQPTAADLLGKLITVNKS